MKEHEGSAGAALGPVRPVQGALFEEGLEEKRYRLEGQGTGKRGKHYGTDHGNSRKSTEEKKI